MKTLQTVAFSFLLIASIGFFGGEELARAQSTEIADAQSCIAKGLIYISRGACHSTMQDAVDALPATGGKIVIPPGNYSCPHDLVGKSNVQFVGEGYDPPAASSHGINSSWLSYPDKKVVFRCNSTWTIDSSNGLVLEGIQIQTVAPQHGDGLVLKGITNSKFSNFSIVGQGSGQAGVGLRLVALGATGTNISRNTFQDFLISGFNGGSVALNGTSATTNCVTLNEFRNYWLTSGAAPTGPSISTSYCTDSNYWYSGTIANLGNTQSALVINNSGNPTVDADSGGNGFFGITVQPADAISYTGPLFLFNQSDGTLIEGASISGGLGGNTNTKIVGVVGSPQFRICFASNFSMPSYSSSCIDQVSYHGVNEISRTAELGPTKLYSVPVRAAGFYRVYGEMWMVSPGDGNVSFTVSSNIGGYAASQNTPALSLTKPDAVPFSFDVFAAPGTDITWQTLYRPSGAYGLRVRIAYEPQGN
jgi:hypothetical protein